MNNSTNERISYGDFRDFDIATAKKNKKTQQHKTNVTESQEDFDTVLSRIPSDHSLVYSLHRYSQAHYGKQKYFDPYLRILKNISQYSLFVLIVLSILIFQYS